MSNKMKVGLVVNIVLMVLVLFGLVGHINTSSAATNTPQTVVNVEEIAKQLKSLDADEPLVIELPETFMYQDADQWASIENTMRNTTAKTIILRVSGFGGQVNIGNRFIRTIQDVQREGKVVNMDIIGASYSLHAYITCFANEVSIRPGAALMFHAAYSIDTFLLDSITYRNLDNSPADTAFMSMVYSQCKSTNRLTDADIEAVENGKDVTIINENNNIVKLVSEDDLSLMSTFEDVLKDIICISLVVIVIGLIKKV